MRARVDRVGLAVALAVLLVGGAARAERQLWRMFTGEDGLSQLSVQAMVVGPDGRLWVGTEAGLDRFDGQRFVRARGLSSAHVVSLAWAGDALYVGTAAGVDRVTPDGEASPYSRTRGLPPGEVRVLAVDGAGHVFAGLDEGLYESDGGPFVAVPGLETERVDALWAGPEGLWVGTPSGLSLLHGGRLDRLGAQAGLRSVTVIAQGLEGRRFVGTSAGQLHTLEGTRWLEVEQIDDVVRPQIFSIHTQADGTVWVGHEAGLERRRGGRTKRFGVDDRLRISRLVSVVEDHEGGMWAGGFGGIARFVGAAFEIFDEQDGLPSANTRPILRTRDGELWVGTTRGVARWRGGRFEAFGPEDGLAGTYVLDLHEDARGEVYAATGRGLFVFEGAGWAKVEVPKDKEGITGLDEDRAGRLWVVTPEAGVFVRAGAAFRHVPTPGNRLVDPRLLVDSRDRVWVSGSDGLSLIEDGVQSAVFSTAHGFVRPAPYFMAEAPDGAIWFGYYHAQVGLSRFDGQRVTHTYSVEDGLSHGAVYSLGFGADGALWVGTARGVDRFEEGRFRNFGPLEGFPSTESNAGGFLLEPDGRIWFGTAEGLARFDPRFDTGVAPRVAFALREVWVGDLRVLQDGLQISREDEDLRVRVALSSFEHPRQLEVRARLRGLSDDWDALEGDEWVVPRVPAGLYTVEVQARRRDMPWPAPARLGFEILRPWWARPLAILGGLAVLAGLVWLIARLRVAQLEAQNARLQRMVEQRTAGLEAKTAELEKAQERLRRNNQELIEASQAKSQFVANVSHEMRTPMNGILGMTELALAEPVSARVRECMTTVKASGEALLLLINDILDLARIESGRMVPEPVRFSLSDLLEGVRRTSCVAAEDKGLDLRITVEEGLPDRWYADARRLRQVLVNLVGNAVKFTAEGEVEVRVGREGGGDVEDRLRFEVRDTGMGIPEHMHEAVFELFTQVDGSTTRQHGGTGLGLTICRELVQVMQGELILESEVGQGTTFSFSVPLEPILDGASVDLISAPTPRQLDLPIAAEGLRVLVAEDNRVNQLVVRRMLERLGHQVRVVEDGQAAIEALAEDRFDCVLMDVQMPRLDGIEATRRIRAQEGGARRVPIVALTAHAMAGDRERTEAAGMDGYLTKPLSSQDLRDALAAACEAV